MITKESEIKLRINQLKQVISSYEIVNCLKYDLQETTYNWSIYSDELDLFRDRDDDFIYLRDNDDDTVGRVSIEDLKVIIRNIASREVNDKFELMELNTYLFTEDDE